MAPRWGNSPSSTHRGTRGWSTVYVARVIVPSIDLVLDGWRAWLVGGASHVLLRLLLRRRLIGSVSRNMDWEDVSVCVHIKYMYA